MIQHLPYTAAIVGLTAVILRLILQIYAFVYCIVYLEHPLRQHGPISRY